uniref:Uncharacterized protein n=1 Tax=Oryza glaberrima TaxID=4538 RepID=I1Q988_ORYGL
MSSPPRAPLLMLCLLLLLCFALATSSGVGHGQRRTRPSATSLAWSVVEENAAAGDELWRGMWMAEDVAAPVMISVMGCRAATTELQHVE